MGAGLRRVGQRVSDLADKAGGVSQRNRAHPSGEREPGRIDPCERMSNPFRTPEDYELFIYNLPDQFKSIRHSTLVLIRMGASLGRVAGELQFDHGFRLLVRERILFDRLPLVIDWYGYEVWREGTKLFWYDSQPHPNDPALRQTHPHHKHIQPNIKNNRIPAPQIRFDYPNFQVLIEEIEQ